MRISQLSGHLQCKTLYVLQGTNTLFRTEVEMLGIFACNEIEFYLYGI